MGWSAVLVYWNSGISWDATSKRKKKSGKSRGHWFTLLCPNIVHFKAIMLAAYNLQQILKYHLWKWKPPAFLAFTLQYARKTLTVAILMIQTSMENSQCSEFLQTSVSKQLWSPQNPDSGSKWEGGLLTELHTKSGALTGGAGRFPISFSSAEARRQLQLPPLGPSTWAMHEWFSYLVGQKYTNYQVSAAPTALALSLFKKIHITLTRMTLIIRTDNNKVGKDMEKLELSNGTCAVENSLEDPEKVKHTATIWPRSNSTPRHIPKRNENICLCKNPPQILTAALFIAKKEKQPKCPPTDE